METPVAALEKRLQAIELKLDALSQMHAAGASRRTVWVALGAGAAIAFAVMAMFVGALAFVQGQGGAQPGQAARSEPPAVPQRLIIELAPGPAGPPPSSPAPTRLPPATGTPFSQPGR